MKSPQAFRTISEVSSEIDIPAHVLRFWETKFPNINPLKRSGNRRYYRPEDVKLIIRIKTLLYDKIDQDIVNELQLDFEYYEYTNSHKENQVVQTQGVRRRPSS